MELAFSKGLYEKSALLKAAYSFTEVAYLHLSQDDKNWYVSWHNKPGETLPSEAFENALIEQQLRKELLHESRDLPGFRRFANSPIGGQSRILCKLQNVVQIEQNLCKTGAAQAAAALFIK